MAEEARELIVRFLVEMDQLLDPADGPHTIHLSGAAAITLGYGGMDRTKDVDAVTPAEAFLDILKTKAGRNSKLYERDILEEIDTNFNRVRIEMLGLAPEDWSGEY